MQCIEMKLLGETYQLYYNVEAMFQVQERFPEGVLEQIMGSSKESVQLLYCLFTVFVEQANNARKLCGYMVPPSLPQFSEVWPLLTPADINNMRYAIFSAIEAGCENRVESLEDTDLTLVEFKKKQETE